MSVVGAWSGEPGRQTARAWNGRPVDAEDQAVAHESLTAAGARLADQDAEHARLERLNAAREAKLDAEWEAMIRKRLGR